MYASSLISTSFCKSDVSFLRQALVKTEQKLLYLLYSNCCIVDNQFHINICARKLVKNTMARKDILAGNAFISLFMLYQTYISEKKIRSSSVQYNLIRTDWILQREAELVFKLLHSLMQNSTVLALATVLRSLCDVTSMWHKNHNVMLSWTCKNYSN